MGKNYMKKNLKLLFDPENEEEIKENVNTLNKELTNLIKPVQQDKKIMKIKISEVKPSKPINTKVLIPNKM